MAEDCKIPNEHLIFATGSPAACVVPGMGVILNAHRMCGWRGGRVDKWASRAELPRNTPWTLIKGVLYLTNLINFKPRSLVSFIFYLRWVG